MNVVGNRTPYYNVAHHTIQYFLVWFYSSSGIFSNMSRGLLCDIYMVYFMICLFFINYFKLEFLIASLEKTPFL